MDADALRSFVVDAHANGYAEGGGQPGPDGIKRIEYELGGWRYLDVYVGTRDFLGAEFVFDHGDPVWGMHYYGYLLDDAVAADDVYGFLREALSDVDEDHPFRGPDHVRADFAYENRSSGSIERFHGEETIGIDGTPLYEGYYRGGLVD